MSKIRYSINEIINRKVCYQFDDITKLEVDTIVNAANKTLLGGGGVDGAIHRAAGHELLKACKTLGGCKTGHAKITIGYRLPAKYVIHTVGPIGEKEDKLSSCYLKSLELMRYKQLRSIAFPCISTGIYGYPNKNAAHVVLRTVRDWLEEHHDSVDKIIFCLFLDIDRTIYAELWPHYFPGLSSVGSSVDPEKAKKKKNYKWSAKEDDCKKPDQKEEIDNGNLEDRKKISHRHEKTSRKNCDLEDTEMNRKNEERKYKISDKEKATYI